MQAKLLKVIEDKKFKRLGGTSDIKVDVRIIAASNRELSEAIKEKMFREDLYYRLNVVAITLPPLRERKEDIPLLVEFFIDKFNMEFKKDVKGISKEAEELLINHTWPGNVRELSNYIERICVLGNECITAKEVEKSLITSTDNYKVKELNLKQQAEYKYIKEALEKANGNKTKAAQIFGCSLTTFRNKARNYELIK